MAARSTPGIGTRRVVVLVDDDPDILDSLGALLQHSLPKVTTLMAGSVGEAINLLESQRVDVLVSDYKMPDGGGARLMREASRIAPEVPRILVTGHADLELAMEAINKGGVSHFIQKPVDPEGFIRLIVESLRERTREANRSAAFAAALHYSRRRVGEDES